MESLNDNLAGNLKKNFEKPQCVEKINNGRNPKIENVRRLNLCSYIYIIVK